PEKNWVPAFAGTNALGNCADVSKLVGEVAPFRNNASDDASLFLVSGQLLDLVQLIRGDQLQHLGANGTALVTWQRGADLDLLGRRTLAQIVRQVFPQLSFRERSCTFNECVKAMLAPAVIE